MVQYYNNIKLLKQCKVKMPKYYAKQDVQKGLVDPKKPLEQQPQYKEVLQRKKQEEYNDQGSNKKIYKQRQNKQEEYNDQGSNKKIYKQRHNKYNDQESNKKIYKQRHNKVRKSKYNWDWSAITLQTCLPPKRKQVQLKPNRDQFLEGLNKLKDQREKLHYQKKMLINEQRNILKNINQVLKNGKMVKSKYSGIKKEQFQAKKSLQTEIQMFNEKKKEVNQNINKLKNKMHEYEKDDYSLMSVEKLKEKIAKKQHQLTTSASLNKHQSEKINNDINQMKRQLGNAKSKIQIDGQVEKLRDQITIQYNELKDIKKQERQLSSQIKAVKSKLYNIRQQEKEQFDQNTQIKTEKEVKSTYDIKIDHINNQIDQIQDKIKDYKDIYNIKLDEYDDQQQQIKYIQFIKDQQKYLKDKAEQKEKRKREQQQREKKKQKEKEEYEKRKEQKMIKQEQRRIKQEQRKKKQEEKGLKLEMQRMAYINRNPNFQQIQICNFLIGYCKKLNPQKQEVIETNKAVVDPSKILLEGKAWEKQIKGGAQILISKKANLDEQIPKKAKRQKKNQQIKVEIKDNFSHNMQISERFHQVNLLPPSTVQEIEPVIKQIEERIVIYQKPTQEQIAQFQAFAVQEFDRKHGLIKEKKIKFVVKDNGGTQYKQKPQKQKKYCKQNNEVLDQKQFPQLQQI